MVHFEDVRALYADIFDSGGLHAALSQAFVDRGSPLVASGTGEEIFSQSYASARLDDRSSNVLLATQERLFLLEFWRRGVQYARGKTADISDVARVIDRWVARACTLDELASFPFVTLTTDARAFYEGREVELRWQQLLQCLPGHIPQLVEFANEAARAPELRQLFPFTSLDFFCFSLCTGYPYTRVTPIVHGGRYGTYDGTYRVYFPGSRPPDGLIGVGNAFEAVLLVVEYLPRGCGPAVSGTAEDLSFG